MSAAVSLAACGPNLLSTEDNVDTEQVRSQVVLCPNPFLCNGLQEQGILHAQSVDSGGAKLHITLLAAGFVIGEAHRLAGITCPASAFHAFHLLTYGTHSDLTASSDQTSLEYHTTVVAWLLQAPAA